MGDENGSSIGLMKADLRSLDYVLAESLLGTWTCQILVRIARIRSVLGLRPIIVGIGKVGVVRSGFVCTLISMASCTESSYPKS